MRHLLQNTGVRKPGVLIPAETRGPIGKERDEESIPHGDFHLFLDVLVLIVRVYIDCSLLISLFFGSSTVFQTPLLNSIVPP